MSAPFDETKCCIKHGTINRQCGNTLSKTKTYKNLKICTRHYNDIFIRGKHLYIYEASGNTKALMIPHSHRDKKIRSGLFDDSDKKPKETKKTSKRCTRITKKGTRCKRNNNGVSKCCFQHDPNHITKNISSSKRESLWINTFGEKFLAKCQVCESATITPFRFEVGHNKPKCNGGDNKMENLRCVCSKCNRSMGTQTLEEWKKNLMD